MDRYTDCTFTTKRITVDCKKKKVKFEDPEPKNRNKILSTIRTLFDLYLLTLNIGIVMLFTYWIVFSALLILFGLNEILIVIYLFLIPLVYSLIITVAYTILIYLLIDKEIYFSFLVKIDYVIERFLRLGEEYLIEVTQLDGMQFEIPLYSNYYLHYEATMEFSEFLERIEIREIPYTKVSRFGGKKKKTADFWKATFIFERQPTIGKLIVRFI